MTLACPVRLSKTAYCCVHFVAQVSAAKRRYEVGLQKLEFTGEQVVLMQNELTALKPNLIRTVAETEQLMARWGGRRLRVNCTSTVVEVPACRAERKAAEVCSSP